MTNLVKCRWCMDTGYENYWEGWSEDRPFIPCPECQQREQPVTKEDNHG